MLYPYIPYRNIPRALSIFCLYTYSIIVENLNRMMNIVISPLASYEASEVAVGAVHHNYTVASAGARIKFARINMQAHWHGNKYCSLRGRGSKGDSRTKLTSPFYT